MDAYFSENLDLDTAIDFSDSGYTNDQIGVRWLQHFIQHTNSSATSEKKLLLFDGHNSHTTSEFQELAAANIIIIIIITQYPAHLTHLLQPLDVGVFQPYKH